MPQLGPDEFVVLSPEVSGRKFVCAFSLPARATLCNETTSASPSICSLIASALIVVRTLTRLHKNQWVCICRISLSL